MRLALGERGARLIALGHRDLDARLPRAGHPDGAARLLRDGARRRLLRGASGGCTRARRVPVLAIALQGAVAAVIARLGPLRADPELRGVGRLHLVRAHRRPRSSSTGGAASEGPSGRPATRWTTAFFVLVVLGGRGRHDPPLPGRQRDRPRRSSPSACAPRRSRPVRHRGRRDGQRKPRRAPRA